MQQFYSYQFKTVFSYDLYFDLRVYGLFFFLSYCEPQDRLLFFLKYHSAIVYNDNTDLRTILQFMTTSNEQPFNIDQLTIPLWPVSNAALRSCFHRHHEFWQCIDSLGDGRPSSEDQPPVSPSAHLSTPEMSLLMSNLVFCFCFLHT